MNKICLLPLAALALTISSAFAAPAPTPNYHLLQKVTLGGDGGWDYLTVDPDARRLYLSRGTHMMVVDADTYKIIGDIPNTEGVHGIALAPKLGRGFTSNGRANSVTIVDLKTLKSLGTVPVGTNPDAILYEPKTQRVFTFNGGSNDATVLDAKTGKVLNTIALGGRPEFAVADGTGMIYNNIEDKSEIVAIDASSLTIKTRWPLAPAEGPSGIALDMKDHLLFSTCDGGKMAVSDAAAGKVVGTAPIGNGPDAAEFDPGTGLAFSSNGEDGTLTVLQHTQLRYNLRGEPKTISNYVPLQTIKTQAGARTMALDTKTHRVFLVTAVQDPKNPGQGYRRNYVPGTFTLLVVGP